MRGREEKVRLAIEESVAHYCVPISKPYCCDLTQTKTTRAPHGVHVDPRVAVCPVYQEEFRQVFCS